MNADFGGMQNNNQDPNQLSGMFGNNLSFGGGGDNQPNQALFDSS